MSNVSNQNRRNKGPLAPNRDLRSTDQKCFKSWPSKLSVGVKTRHTSHGTGDDRKLVISA